MKKVIIIGGGVAGFAAGTYLQFNGYETEIIEKNVVAGGACIGWERSGCYIDGCIHWLSGVKNGSDLNKIWLDVNAINKDTVIFKQDDLFKFKFGDKSFILYSDLDKFQKELIAFAPEDEKEIRRFAKLVKKFQKVNPPCFKPVELMNLFDLLKVAFTLGGVYPLVSKTSKISPEDYANRFKNEALRQSMCDFMAPHYNLMSMLYMLGHISADDAGIPEGGSLGVVKRMEERYLSLGGKIRKGISVKKVVIDNDVAKGVLLTNDEVLYSDWVVSTTPVEHCLVDLLENKYHDKKFDMRLANEKIYPIYTYTAVAIKCPNTVNDTSLSVKIELDEPIVLDKEYKYLSFRNYGYDKTVKGADNYCVIQVSLHGDDNMYYYWKNIKNSGNYKEEKSRIGELFLSLAKQVYPDVADDLKVIDVVTPCTYERYLNSRHGSFQGFVHTKKGKSLMQNGRIKGLKNFILAGQYIVQSGGLPSAVMSGRFSAQRICHDDKKKFIEP